MTDPSVSDALRQLRVWVAVGAIGLLLTGVGTLASLRVLDDFSDQAKELESSIEEVEKSVERNDEEDLWSIAAELYDTGKLEELEATITDRQKSRPNDGELFWWRARLHVARGEYSKALEQLDLVELHAPSWTEDHSERLREAIGRMTATSK